MAKFSPRQIILEAVGSPAVADSLHPHAAANQNQAPIGSEEQLMAWAKGAAVVMELVKKDHRRAVSDQLWKFAADPAGYPLELRTVYGGSENPHSVQVLDWALPSLAVAAAMGEKGEKLSPRVTILSADEAAVRINNLDEESAAEHASHTLELVSAIAERYYPVVNVTTRRLTWEQLTADPYEQDVEQLRARVCGDMVTRTVLELEEAHVKRGHDPSGVVEYLGLHNTAYGVYDGSPIVKLAGVPEVRYDRVQEGLAMTHPELVATTTIEDQPTYVSGIIRDTSSTAPYYVAHGASVPEMLATMADIDHLPTLMDRHGLGGAAQRAVMRSLA